MTATTTTREMYVKTRRAWKDGSRVEIEFTSETSVNGTLDHTSNHTVTLFADGHEDLCTCSGFSRWGHCCHIDHFRLVEDLRRRLAVAAQPVQSIEAVVSAINAKCGKVVITVGVPVVVQPAKPPIETAVLNGNRPAMAVSKSVVTTRKVSEDWLTGRRSA